MDLEAEEAVSLVKHSEEEVSQDSSRQLKIKDIFNVETLVVEVLDW